MYMDDLPSPWLILHYLPYLGPSRLKELLTYYEKPEAILKAKPEQLRDVLHPKTYPTLLDFYRHRTHSQVVKTIQADLQKLDKVGGWLLTLGDENYPQLLKNIDDPPAVIFGRGNLQALHLPQVALIGSRNSTRQGLTIAYDYASELSTNGFAITSGLAYGIDAASHSGCLSASGKTIAVLGSGVDNIYPAGNRKLASQILQQGGAIISEYPPGTAPRPGNFPRRNRIISGLSLGVLVVEAAMKSGSLITARVAAEQNREVFALPGSIHNPLSKGCHQLIKNGATLVETAGDVVEQLGGILAFKKEELTVTKKEGEQKGEQEQEQADIELTGLMKILGFSPCSMDELISISGQSAADVASELLDLELEGVVEQVPGGYQRIS